MTGAKPATPTKPAPAKPAPAAPNIDALADAVIRGEYGNGEERRRKLGNFYDQVQARVNAKLTGHTPAPTPNIDAKLTGHTPAPTPNIDALADAVIRGDYGNGEECRRRLGSLYEQVQRRVNQKLGY